MIRKMFARSVNSSGRLLSTSIALLVAATLTLCSVTTYAGAVHNYDHSTPSQFLKNADVDAYAQKTALAHIHNLISIGEISQENKTFKLGARIEINTDTDYPIWVYPVYAGDAMIATLEVNWIDGELSSSMTTEYADLLSNYEDLPYPIELAFFDGGIYVAQEGKIYVLRKSSNHVDHGVEVLQNITALNKERNLGVNSHENSVFEEFQELSSAGYVRPEREKILGVTPLRQDGQNCWAAVCASLINYIRRFNLTTNDVARTIQPADPHGPAYAETIMKAYRNWDVSPYWERGILQPEDVTREIDRYCPIHIRSRKSEIGNPGSVSGHALGLYGYSFWGRELNYEKTYTVFNPINAAVRSVTVRSDGGFTFYDPNGDCEWYGTFTLR